MHTQSQAINACSESNLCDRARLIHGDDPFKPACHASPSCYVSMMCSLMVSARTCTDRAHGQAGLLTLNLTPGISPTACPLRPNPAMRTSSCTGDGTCKAHKQELSKHKAAEGGEACCKPVFVGRSSAVLVCHSIICLCGGHSRAGGHIC